tara:strand:- start:1592 stop:1903 length:312 start_codon:yes stop_codon:yes gene_type:complete
MSIDLDNLDFDAIFKAYAGTVVTISDGAGAFDASGNPVTLEQSKIDAARVQLDNEHNATKYQRQRKAEYPDWGDQLDYIYHNGIDKWKTDIVDPIKAKYPKPS